jgi:hypothetical protein
LFELLVDAVQIGDRGDVVAVHLGLDAADPDEDPRIGFRDVPLQRVAVLGAHDPLPGRCDRAQQAEGKSRHDPLSPHRAVSRPQPMT